MKGKGKKKKSSEQSFCEFTICKNFSAAAASGSSLNLFKKG